MQDNLDDILMRRAAPQAGPDLAERIIAAARPRPASVPAGFLGEIAAFFREGFLIPKPALVFGIMLALGIYSGWIVEIQSQLTPEEMAQTLAVEDTLSSGEFL